MSRDHVYTVLLPSFRISWTLHIHCITSESPNFMDTSTSWISSRRSSQVIVTKPSSLPIKCALDMSTLSSNLDPRPDSQGVHV